MGYSHVEKVVGYQEFMDQIYKHVQCTLQELRIGNESDTAEMSNVSASLAAAAEAGQWRTGFRAERDQRFTFSLLDSFENFPQLRAAVTEIKVQIEVERRGTSTVRSMTVPVALSIWEIEPRSKTVYSHVEKVVGYKEFMDQIHEHVQCTLQELGIGNESDTAEISNVSASLAAAAEAGQWRTGFRGA